MAKLIVMEQSDLEEVQKEGFLYLFVKLILDYCRTFLNDELPL
jgi:hypothetical protein